MGKTRTSRPSRQGTEKGGPNFLPSPRKPTKVTEGPPGPGRCSLSPSLPSRWVTPPPSRGDLPAKLGSGLSRWFSLFSFNAVTRFLKGLGHKAPARKQTPPVRRWPEERSLPRTSPRASYAPRPPPAAFPRPTPARNCQAVLFQRRLFIDLNLGA